MQLTMLLAHNTASCFGACSSPLAAQIPSKSCKQLATHTIWAAAMSLCLSSPRGDVTTAQLADRSLVARVVTLLRPGTADSSRALADAVGRGVAACMASVAQEMITAT